MPMDKYPCIFYPQIEAIIYIQLLIVDIELITHH